MIDTSKTYIIYAQQVLDHKIIANKHIYLACERMIKWFERDDIYFDYNDVDTKIKFIQKLKHSTGIHAGHNFELMDYQQWIVANIFGWKYVETDERVVNTALLMLARKSGKTFFAAALMLAKIITDKEQGSEGYMIANSARQASIAFKHTKDQCISIDPNEVIFKRFRTEIRTPLLNSTMTVLSSDTSKLDGLNPSIFIVDEFHEARSNEIFSILRTGQGMRKSPLGIVISTAGFNIGDDYPLYSMWTNAKDMLNGVKEEDSLFAAIYQLDEDDDWKDENNWIKSNPTLGHTVSYKYLREQVQSAVNNPSYEVSIKTKNFNMWCQSEVTWVNYESIKAVSKPFDLSMFDSEEEYSIVGLDIAERNDLCVLCALVEHNDLLYFKAYPFVSRTAIQKSKNKSLYKQWIKQGYLTVTNTETIDISYLIKKTQDINEQIPIALVAYDQWHAQQYKIFAEKEGLPCKAVRQGLGAFAEPTTMLEDLILSKKCVIDDNPVTRWCFSNVLIKEDENGNRKPIKSSKENKIDIVITFIQALKLWMELKGIIDNTPLEAIRL